MIDQFTCADVQRRSMASIRRTVRGELFRYTTLRIRFVVRPSVKSRAIAAQETIYRTQPLIH